MSIFVTKPSIQYWASLKFLMFLLFEKSSKISLPYCVFGNLNRNCSHKLCLIREILSKFQFTPYLSSARQKAKIAWIPAIMAKERQT